jgi:hypothetical protein
MKRAYIKQPAFISEADLNNRMITVRSRAMHYTPAHTMYRVLDLIRRTGKPHYTTLPHGAVLRVLP